jgi:hypothetical protein
VVQATSLNHREKIEERDFIRVLLEEIEELRAVKEG